MLLEVGDDAENVLVVRVFENDGVSRHRIGHSQPGEVSLKSSQTDYISFCQDSR